MLSVELMTRTHMYVLFSESSQTQSGKQYYKYTHTRTFNGLFSRTTWVGRYQKDKPFWILLKQGKMGWQWQQLNHMQIICTSLQTDNHASTSSLHIFTGRMPFLPPNQQHQSTEGKKTALQIHGDKQIISNI